MISAAYLTEIAEYTNARIAKVVVNGSYEITSFRIKHISSHMVELEYMIPEGAVAEATLIELQSGAGDVISSNAVYVPITTDTIIKQTIQVKEV